MDQENCASSIGHFGDMVRKYKDFKPYGSKITEFERNSKHFEIYKPTMADPGFRLIIVLAQVGNINLENGICGWKHLSYGLLMVRSILIRMTHSGTISLFLNDFKIQKLERINMQLLGFQPFSDFTVIQRRYDHELG